MAPAGETVSGLADKAVLDLGCGYGWHCKYAMEHGAIRATGIDQSRRMIDEALRRNADDRITYRVCDLRDYEYSEGEYDLVISNLVLHYVEDLNTVYRLIGRTLRPGGIFLMRRQCRRRTGVTSCRMKCSVR